MWVRFDAYVLLSCFSNLKSFKYGFLYNHIKICVQLMRYIPIQVLFNFNINS